MASAALAMPSAYADGTIRHVSRSDAMLDVDRRQELLEIVRERSFRKGDFLLSSGQRSPLYFNMKPTMMSARGAELSALALLDIVHELGCHYVGGLEMGAVPVIGSLAALSSNLGRPVATLFVRKMPKSHGTGEKVEGLGPNETLDGQAVLAIDDVATSGVSILRAIEAIRAAGGIVTDAACLLDRQEGAAAMLATHGVNLHAVLSAEEFV